MRAVPHECPPSEGQTTLQMAGAERSEFLDLLEDLTPAQWDAATLCEGWTVRDVVAHLVSFDDLGFTGTAALLLRARLKIDAVVDLALQPYRSSTPAQLVNLMRDHLTPRGLPTVLGGGLALVDAMVHQQDVRRPLQRPRHIPEVRIHRCLQHALRSPSLPARRVVTTVRLVATDTEWSSGRGPEVHGPAEALLMLMAGRWSAAEQCSGLGLLQLLGDE